MQNLKCYFCHFPKTSKFDFFLLLLHILSDTYYHDMLLTQHQLLARSATSSLSLSITMCQITERAQPWCRRLPFVGNLTKVLLQILC